MRVPGAVEIARQRDELGARPGTLARPCNGLVPIAEAIDEVRRQRLVGEKRSAVDQLGNLRLRQLAGGGDAAHDLSGGRAQQILNFLALRRGHRGLGEAVHRSLVFLAMSKAGEDAEAVERAAEERDFAVQADQAERPQRLQPDLVERGREIIGPGAGAELAEAVGEDDREFAFRAKIGNRVAQFLAGGETERVAAQPDVETLHPRIVAGALQRIEKIAQRLLAAENELRHRALTGSRGEAAAQFGVQHDRLRQGGLAQGEAPDHKTAADKGEHRDDADRGEEAEHKTAHGDSDPREDPLGDLIFPAANPRSVQDRARECYIRRQHEEVEMDDKTRTELEAATFRALVAHLRERTDVQNIDLMNLAGFCRNCLSKWYRAAAEEKGVALSDPEAREIVYGMPYDEWRKEYQKEASARAEGSLRRVATETRPHRLGGRMPDVGGIAGERLRSFIERIERLEEERRTLGADIKEVYAEAKGAGFDTKIMRQLIRLRRMDKDDLDEQETLLDIYKRALGMIPGAASEAAE